MIGLLLALWLAGAMPVSATDCVVRGMVYGADNVAEVELQVTAPAFCNLRIIRFERHFESLLARSRLRPPPGR